MRILMILVPDPSGPPLAPPALKFEAFLSPYYLFVDAGAEVVVASPAGGDPAMQALAGQRSDPTEPMRRFRQDRVAREALSDTLELQQIDPADFDGAYCLGVTGAVWPPAADSPGSLLISRLLADGKPVAAAPAQLDLRPCGAADGLLIMADAPNALGLAAQALLYVMSKP